MTTESTQSPASLKKRLMPALNSMLGIKKEPKTSKGSSSPSRARKGETMKSMVAQKGKNYIPIQEESQSPTLSATTKRKGGRKNISAATRKYSKMSTVNLSGGFNLQPVDNPSVQDIDADDNDKVVTGEVAATQNENEGARGGRASDDDEFDDKDADEQSRLREIKCQINRLEQNQRKPLAKLSYEKRGWNAPQDEPYVPVGRMTELVTAVEQIRQNLPHTRERFKKQTYRKIMLCKKRERDLADKMKINLAIGQGKTAAELRDSMSDSCLDQLKMEDQSRIVKEILPSEKATLLDLRNYAYDEQQRELKRRRQSAPIGPRFNQFGKLAAGYVNKKNERRDEIEGNAHKTMKQEAKGDPADKKSHIEQQMEAEKSRYWIRKLNGRIYDEQIKNLIMTTDNGSSLLKQEIQDSEQRLASIKLGRHLDEVVPRNREEFFMTNKEDYFRGDKRILRRQEREQLNQQQQQQQEPVESPKQERLVSARSDIGQNFQTIHSVNEMGMQNVGGGFFLTEQPVLDSDDRKNYVKIPDLLEERKVDSLAEEPPKVNDMFAFASNKSFEKVYRATTSHVKSLYLNRLKSRDRLGGDITTTTIPNKDLESFQKASRSGLQHQRANSLSTAAASSTLKGGFYRSKNQMQQAQAADTDSNQLASNVDTSRLRSAMTNYSMKNSRTVIKSGGSTGSVAGGRHRVSNSMYIKSYNVGEVPQAADTTEFGSLNNQSTSGLRNSQGLTFQQDHHPQALSKDMVSQSQVTFDPKKVLKDANKRRAMNMSQALSKDVNNQRNRVRYLQNLHKERIAQKKMDHAKGSDIFNGFSQDEIHEILVELPELKQMAKEKAALIEKGGKNPKFSRSQLIHLDSLNDIANRGQAEMRKKINKMIEKRKTRITQDVNNTDQKHGFDSQAFGMRTDSFQKANAELLKKFQQGEGNDDKVEQNFRFKDTLQLRLNYAEGLAHKQLFETFKDEYWSKLVWDENGVERAGEGDSSLLYFSQNNLQTSHSLADRIGNIFDEQQQQQQAASIEQEVIRGGAQVKKVTQSVPLNAESKQQVDDEMREFDDSEQLLLFKLIEVYEQRLYDEKNPPKPNEEQEDAETSKGQEQALKVKPKTSKNSLIKRKGTSQVIIEETSQSQRNLMDLANCKEENILAGMPPRAKGRRETGKSTTKVGGGNSLASQPTMSKQANAKRDSTKTAETGRPIAAANSLKFQNPADRKANHKLKKAYQKFYAEQIGHEYLRSYEAIVGSTDDDLDAVLEAFTPSGFYKLAKEFLVVQGKYMTEDHLLILNQDPKTILMLYRLYMLNHKTNQMTLLNRKVTQKKPSKAGRAPKTTASSALLNSQEEEDSDYSDSDFQDLMSNKQIEENIRVFFDRIHELVNPIDQQRLKLDSVAQIKSTVKAFYKRKANLSEQLLQELDQMCAERPKMIKVKQRQFNDPIKSNQGNLHHIEGPTVPISDNQQVLMKMIDVRLNSELYRLRRFKQVAEKTSKWYNTLAALVLAEGYQDEPLVLYMLDQVKHVIEIGEEFKRSHFRHLMASFDAMDARKPEVIRVSKILDQVLPRNENDVDDLGCSSLASQPQSHNNRNHKVTFETTAAAH